MASSRAVPIIVGVSRRTKRDEPTLEAALANAWSKKPRGRRRLRVLSIEVSGTNPIDMYSVVVSADI